MLSNRMKWCWVVLVFVGLAGITQAQTITVDSMTKRFSDMHQLSHFPNPNFKALQFSSYDRRSNVPGGKYWDCNSDGGNEPIPNFEKVLRKPGEDNIGEYLICDVKGPGCIVRTWRAERMTGNIRMYLDGSDTAVYDGPAGDFMKGMFVQFDSGIDSDTMGKCYVQRDSCYFPVPFSKSCRVIWEGNTRNIHFYHLQMELYDPSVNVDTFTVGQIKQAAETIQKTAEIFSDINGNYEYSPDCQEHQFEVNLPATRSVRALELTGSKQVEKLVIRLTADDMVAALRQTIMYIKCDDYCNAQVASPVGDFFGAAPGINVYDSLPFTVDPEGRMTCRYVMPFKEKMVIKFKNFGDQDVTVNGELLTSDYEWDDDSSMYFFARWRVDHNVITRDPGLQDLPFVIARGRGCYVGTTSLMMNPSNVPTRYGSWWGEGDEKIFVDNDIQPSFFGTGTEDYYNYSWSAVDIFAYPYCGQPRNDGPANRGFITNYRWHITDRIPFKHSIFFYMELYSHERVKDFSYARISYYYGMSGTIDDHVFITPDDVRRPELPDTWQPASRRGAAGSVFYQVEDLVKDTTLKIEEDPLWAGAKLACWYPAAGETLEIPFEIKKDGRYLVKFVAAYTNDSGKFTAELNGEPLEFNQQKVCDLAVDHGVLSRRIASQSQDLKAGNHVITLKGVSAGKKIGLDFLWIQKGK